MLYLITTVKYFASYISENPSEFKFNLEETWYRTFFYIFWAYFASHELIQIYVDRISYFLDPTNYFDLASSALNIYLVSNHTHKYFVISDRYEYTLTTIASLLMWIKGLLWLRLFSGTSFYIRLITETIKDIVYFMIILAIFLSAFANAIYILNLYRIKWDPKHLLIH